MKRFLALLLMLAILSGACSAYADGRRSLFGKTEYRYYVVSNDVFLEGQLQNGPAPKATDIELVLSKETVKDGVEVDYYYFGNHYHGKVKNEAVIWDRAPYMVSGGKITYTAIESVYGGVIMTFDFKMNENRVTGRVIQALAPKR